MEHDVQQQEDMELPPGFRFHPTDEELITHYLAMKAADPRGFAPRAVGEADLNKCEPWDLPSRATMGEKEWYFFCVKDRKYPTGLRTNRATESGYWKATGKDREIFRGNALVGMKKTLVFYTGRAPRGGKTGWVMHEYRLDGKHHAGARRLIIPSSVRAGASKDEWVLCRVFKKSIEVAAPVAAAGGKRPSASAACMGTMAVDAGPPSMAIPSMADDDFAACAQLPPLMDVSSLPGSAAGIEPLTPPPLHVTCFSNALEAGQFLNPPCFPLLSVAAPAGSPFLASMMQQAANQYDAGAMVHELLQQEGGGGASQDTGLTSEAVNPAEISSSSRQHMDHVEASLWGY